MNIKVFEKRKFFLMFLLSVAITLVCCLIGNAQSIDHLGKRFRVIIHKEHFSIKENLNILRNNKIDLQVIRDSVLNPFNTQVLKEKRVRKDLSLHIFTDTLFGTMVSMDDTVIYVKIIDSVRLESLWSGLDNNIQDGFTISDTKQRINLKRVNSSIFSRNLIDYNEDKNNFIKTKFIKIAERAGFYSYKKLPKKYKRKFAQQLITYIDDITLNGNVYLIKYKFRYKNRFFTMKDAYLYTSEYLEKIYKKRDSVAYNFGIKDMMKYLESVREPLEALENTNQILDKELKNNPHLADSSISLIISCRKDFFDSLIENNVHTIRFLYELKNKQVELPSDEITMMTNSIFHDSFNKNKHINIFEDKTLVPKINFYQYFSVYAAYIPLLVHKHGIENNLYFMFMMPISFEYLNKVFNINIIKSYFDFSINDKTNILSLLLFYRKM